MKYIRYLAILGAILGVLVIGMPAMAAPPPPLAVTPGAGYSVQGMEIFPGFAIGRIRYGATFVAQATGISVGSYTGPLYNGSLSTSINYQGPNPNPGASNAIIGGSWTLSVFQYGVRVGTISGKVQSGSVVWSPAGTTEKGAVSIILLVTGANGVFHALIGHTGTFIGEDNHVSQIFIGNIQVPTIGGVLILH